MSPPSRSGYCPARDRAFERRGEESNAPQLILQELNELFEFGQIQIGNCPPLHA